jgi:hypothetical protein
MAEMVRVMSAFIAVAVPVHVPFLKERKQVYDITVLCVCVSFPFFKF